MINLNGVFAVPPLARQATATRELDREENERIVGHIRAGGITRVIYGGNAFLYHSPLAEFASLIEWLTSLSNELLVIPSVGPSFGRAIDQAVMIRAHRFPCVMVLPSADPRDAEGLDRGYREIAEAAGKKLLIYLKDERNFGDDRLAGLDAVARLVDDGICTGIKYAVVRERPEEDWYLDELLTRVDRRFVISGIGERPAVTHLEKWKLPGFTTGSGCVAPSLTQQIFEACGDGEFDRALVLRELFLPHEDLRDAWGPARVLHHSVELAGIARTGPILPYLSPLSDEQLRQLDSVSKTLMSNNH